MKQEQNSVWITPHYLPSVGYFTNLVDSNRIHYDPSQKFIKQTLRNRTFLLGPHKIERLTIPVHDASKQLPMQEIKIDYAENWIKNHLKTIQNCYITSPYFEYYYPYFESVFLKKPAYLLELTLPLLTLCLKFCQMPLITPDQMPIQTESLGYLEKNPQQWPTNFQPIPYQQNFGKQFVPNLSIMDALFCLGPETRQVLHKSACQ